MPQERPKKWQKDKKKKKKRISPVSGSLDEYDQGRGGKGVGTLQDRNYGVALWALRNDKMGGISVWSYF